MKELFRKLFCMLCKALSEPEEKSQFTEFHIARVGLKQEIEQAFSWMRDIKLDDNDYYYVLQEDWGIIFDDVLQDLPTYTTEKFDCDNFADYTRVQVASKYGINTCARVDGNTYRGRHAWCLFYDELGFHQLEPQTGEVMELDDKRYVPDQIIMG